MHHFPRQSCDECHNHKVKCVKVPDGACERCAVLGLDCKFSLPKKYGRPSKSSPALTFSSSASSAQSSSAPAVTTTRGSNLGPRRQLVKRESSHQHTEAVGPPLSRPSASRSRRAAVGNSSSADASRSSPATTSSTSSAASSRSVLASAAPLVGSPLQLSEREGRVDPDVDGDGDAEFEEAGEPARSFAGTSSVWSAGGRGGVDSSPASSSFLLYSHTPPPPPIGQQSFRNLRDLSGGGVGDEDAMSSGGGGSGGPSRSSSLDTGYVTAAESISAATAAAEWPLFLPPSGPASSAFTFLQQQQQQQSYAYNHSHHQHASPATIMTASPHSFHAVLEGGLEQRVSSASSSSSSSCASSWHSASASASAYGSSSSLPLSNNAIAQDGGSSRTGDHSNFLFTSSPWQAGVTAAAAAAAAAVSASSEFENLMTEFDANLLMSFQSRVTASSASSSGAGGSSGGGSTTTADPGSAGVEGFVVGSGASRLDGGLDTPSQIRAGILGAGMGLGLEMDLIPVLNSGDSIVGDALLVGDANARVGKDDEEEGDDDEKEEDEGGSGELGDVTMRLPTSSAPGTGTGTGSGSGSDSGGCDPSSSSQSNPATPPANRSTLMAASASSSTLPGNSHSIATLDPPSASMMGPDAALTAAAFNNWAWASSATTTTNASAAPASLAAAPFGGLSAHGEMGMMGSSAMHGLQGGGQLVFSQLSLADLFAQQGQQQQQQQSSIPAPMHPYQQRAHSIPASVWQAQQQQQQYAFQQPQQQQPYLSMLPTQQQQHQHQQQAWSAQARGQLYAQGQQAAYGTNPALLPGLLQAQVSRSHSVPTLASAASMTMPGMFASSTSPTQQHQRVQQQQEHRPRSSAQEYALQMQRQQAAQAQAQARAQAEVEQAQRGQQGMGRGRGPL